MDHSREALRSAVPPADRDVRAGHTAIDRKLGGFRFFTQPNGTMRLGRAFPPGTETQSTWRRDGITCIMFMKSVRMFHVTDYLMTFDCIGCSGSTLRSVRRISILFLLHHYNSHTKYSTSSYFSRKKDSLQKNKDIEKVSSA